MQSNTVRMTALPFMPSACTIRQAPRRSRAPEPVPARVGDYVRLAGAVVLLAAASLATGAASGATSRIGYMPPAAQISVTDTFVSPPRTWTFHELGLFQACGAEQVRYAAYENDAGFAAAEAGKGDNHFATASAEWGGALAQAAVLVRNTDPQDRGTVKLNVKFKAHALAGPEPLGDPPTTSANYQLMMEYLTRTPTAVVDGCTVQSAEWMEDLIQQPRVFEVLGYEFKSMGLDGSVHTSSAVRIYDYGQETGQTTQSNEPMTAAVEVASNRGVV